MLMFLLKRLLLLIPTFFGITLLTFFLIHSIPGDPVQIMLGERSSDPQVYANMMANLGLDNRFMSSTFIILEI